MTTRPADRSAGPAPGSTAAITAGLTAGLGGQLGASRPTRPPLAVWAPAAEEAVTLVLNGVEHDMTPADTGWWTASVEARPGARYAYRIDHKVPHPDPRALRLPDGPDGAAEVVDVAAHEWADTGWAGVQLAGAVIYELHIGTFTAQGTLDSAIERLDQLVDLGVDLVEVMPVATFPGRFGWGYDGVGLYAVHAPYGGPEAFCRFVDACHTRGLGVCLDVVYNHLGPSGDHLAAFGPYYTDRYGTPWGQALNLDGPLSDEVRGFLLDNALMWLADLHVDALRLDAVHALFDERAIPFLEELSASVDALAARVGRPLWLIAESDRNDPRTVTPREAGGTGLHAQWVDDVHHALHVLLTGETQGYYADFAEPGALAKVLSHAFLHDGTYSTFRRHTHGRPVDRSMTPGWRFVASLQTHDQVGNRATGDRLSDSLDPGTLACGVALLLTSPYTPMLFMGEEWAASTPWQYFTDHTDPALAAAVREGRREEFGEHGWSPDEVPDPQARSTPRQSTLDWAERSDGRHGRVLGWYRDLIALRRERPDLRDPRLDQVVVHHDGVGVVVERGEHRVAVNLGDIVATLDLVPRGLRMDVVLAWSDDASVAEGAVRLPARSAAVLGPT